MRIRKAILLIILLVLIELIIGVWVVRSVRTEELDMVQVNDLIHACAEAWPSGKMPDSEYPYAIFDRNGKLLYTQHVSGQLTLQKAIQERGTLLDLYQDGQLLGKIVLINDYTDDAAQMGRRLLILFIINAAVWVLILIVYMLRVKKNILQPFNQLRSFAVRVANGNLDIPLTMDKNNYFGAFTESFDLMREELKRAHEQERYADRSKKELVAKLSHDIKTPIASIKAVAEVMAVSAQGEKEKQQLSIIQAKADQIDTLISNLFHATLEELQELEVHPAEQSSKKLTELLRQADYLKKAQIGEIPECLIQMDELRLQQVFDNLFGNSYKYANTPVQVNAVLSNGMLHINLRDYGPGIPPEELPLLYEKFYRGSNAAGKSGAGLGLYISHYLMEEMGGALNCYNMENGFCVRVSLKI